MFLALVQCMDIRTLAPMVALFFKESEIELVTLLLPLGFELIPRVLVLESRSLVQLLELFLVGGLVVDQGLVEDLLAFAEEQELSARRRDAPPVPLV